MAPPTITTVSNALSRRKQQQSWHVYYIVLAATVVVLLCGLVVLMATWRHAVMATTQWNYAHDTTTTTAMASGSSANKKNPKEDDNNNKDDSSPTLPVVVCKISTQNNHNNGANGLIHITVHTDVAPLASQAFLDLVDNEYYDGVFIFRVLKNFIAQWGIRHADLQPWPFDKPPQTARDDVTTHSLSNTRGTLSFAGGNPATCQVFINFNDANVRLDKEGNRPFATLDADSMKIVDRLYTGYADGSGQVKYLKQGWKAMLQQFPEMSLVEYCRVKKTHKMTT